jgi:hypothetical protein
LPRLSASALVRLLLAPLMVCLLAGAAAPARAAAEPLEQRLQAWPAWSLPAPLPRPRRGHDLLYPDWFAGQWRASSHDPSGLEPDLHYSVRFQATAAGKAVGERAFNATAIGRALLGDQLITVRDDPRNPNRQLAELAGDQQLESTVVGRRSSQPAADLFLADELALQVLHGPGDPRVSRVETLSRYRRVSPDRIEAEQWQARYGSPADGLAAEAVGRWSGQLTLEREAFSTPKPEPTQP